MQPHRMPQPPAGGPTTRQRRRLLRIAGLLLLVILAIYFVPQAFNLPSSGAGIEASSLLLVVQALGLLATLILGLVLFRQALKLYAERRANVLGSKFRTKLVIGALGLSLLPVVFMFLFTFGLINHTLEKWFSRPVESVRDDTREIGSLMADYVYRNAGNVAAGIAGDQDVRRALASGDARQIQAALSARRNTWQATLSGGFALLALPDGNIVASLNAPAPWRSLADVRALAGADRFPLLAGRQIALARVAMAEDGHEAVVYAGLPLPPQLTAEMDQVKADLADYQRLSRERRVLRRVYTFYLLLLTLAVLFAATWFALFLSKLVTVPIQALVEATDEISRGNLSHRISVSGKDEIGALVQSFNRMAEELESSRSQAEASRQDLRQANEELDRRRTYTETLLESIPSAVLSIGNDGSISRINPAVVRMFGPSAAVARHLRDLFDAEGMRQFDHLWRRAIRLGVAAGQLELSVVPDVGEPARSLTIAATLATLPLSANGGPAALAPLSSAIPGRADAQPFASSPDGADNVAAAPPAVAGSAGYVLVLEDLTDLLRVQQMAAWREVARRIAHEIKNPLTPIALSAQRISRRVARFTDHAAEKDAGALNETLAVVNECASTIAGEVATLQRLVDEFSLFARFPAATPVLCDLNEIIQRALRVFADRLQDVRVRTDLQPLPPLRLDADAMKRVFVNLIDNAAEAMLDSPYREIAIVTVAHENSVEAVIADSGHGIRREDKERLFLPYFTTRRRGTGLGLAVVRGVVEEHGGTIRVEPHQPVGTRFILELPLPAAAAPVPAGAREETVGD
jgi:two-component system nitrogen regulation sensor histidine kinase NtrY